MPIPSEETKLETLKQQADKADAAAVEARKRLVDAKLDGAPESVEKPLSQAVVAAEAQASGSRAAVGAQERLLEQLREEQARRDHADALNGTEAELAEARGEYGAAFALFERDLTAAAAAYVKMADARTTEMVAARKMARLEGDTNPVGFLSYVRLPQPRSASAPPLDPFANPERTLGHYRPRV